METDMAMDTEMVMEMDIMEDKSCDFQFFGSLLRSLYCSDPDPSRPGLGLHYKCYNPYYFSLLYQK